MNQPKWQSRELDLADQAAELEKQQDSLVRLAKSLVDSIRSNSGNTANSWQETEDLEAGVAKAFERRVNSLAADRFQQQSHLKRLERLSSYVESSTITMSRTIDRLQPDDLTADRLHKLVEELHDEITFLRSISHHLNSPTLATSHEVRRFYDHL